MTKETLEQGKELMSQIERTEKVISTMSALLEGWKGRLDELEFNDMRAEFDKQMLITDSGYMEYKIRQDIMQNLKCELIHRINRTITEKRRDLKKLEVKFEKLK